MNLGLASPRRALGYTLLFLTAGFVWGGISANVEMLSEAGGIPYFAHNWAVALPVFTIWIGLGFVLARRYLASVGGGAAEGLRLGILFAVAAILFDAVIVAGIVGEGLRHFEQPILWLAYGLLVLIPWAVGRSR